MRSRWSRAGILPLLHKLFDVVEETGYGGGVLHLVLAGIAHNFRDGDAEAAMLLRLMGEVEDLLIASGDVPDNFTAPSAGACRKG